jgi:hypothetical protein
MLFVKRRTVKTGLNPERTNAVYFRVGHIKQIARSYYCKIAVKILFFDAPFIAIGHMPVWMKG